MTDETTSIDETTEEVAAEPTPKKVRVTEKAESDIRKEPNLESKKGIVYLAGISEEGGSISGLSASMDCTESNVRQHLSQINTQYGFAIRIEGDTFTISGEPTITWEDQVAEKEAADAEKRAAKAEAAAEKRAAKAAAEEEAVYGDGTDDTADTADTTDDDALDPDALDEDTFPS